MSTQTTKEYLISTLHKYHRKDPWINNIYNEVGRDLENAASKHQQNYDNLFFDTCDTSGAAVYEKDLAIKDISNDLSVRRLAIQSKWLAKYFSSVPILQMLADEFYGKNGIQVKYADGELTFIFHDYSDFGNLSKYMKAADEIKPAHIAMLIIIQILHKWQIHHVAEIMQYVDARHRVWNLGAARSTYWDNEFCFDEEIRYDGIYPNERYRERQEHRLETIWLVGADLELLASHQYQISMAAMPRQNVAVRLNGESALTVQSKASVTTSHISEVTQCPQLSQRASSGWKNRINGSFRLDYSHRLNGTEQANHMLQHRCTVIQITAEEKGEIQTL